MKAVVHEVVNVYSLVTISLPPSSAWLEASQPRLWRVGRAGREEEVDEQVQEHLPIQSLFR